MINFDSGGTITFQETLQRKKPVTQQTKVSNSDAAPAFNGTSFGKSPLAATILSQHPNVKNSPSFAGQFYRREPLETTFKYKDDSNVFSPVWDQTEIWGAKEYLENLLKTNPSAIQFDILERSETQDDAARALLLKGMLEKKNIKLPEGFDIEAGREEVYSIYVPPEFGMTPEVPFYLTVISSGDGVDAYFKEEFVNTEEGIRRESYSTGINVGSTKDPNEINKRAAFKSLVRTLRKIVDQKTKTEGEIKVNNPNSDKPKEEVIDKIEALEEHLKDLGPIKMDIMVSQAITAEDSDRSRVFLDTLAENGIALADISQVNAGMREFYDIVIPPEFGIEGKPMYIKIASSGGPGNDVLMIEELSKDNNGALDINRFNRVITDPEELEAFKSLVWSVRKIGAERAEVDGELKKAAADKLSSSDIRNLPGGVDAHRAQVHARIVIASRDAQFKNKEEYTKAAEIAEKDSVFYESVEKFANNLTTTPQADKDAVFAQIKQRSETLAESIKKIFALPESNKPQNASEIINKMKAEMEFYIKLTNVLTEKDKEPASLDEVKEGIDSRIKNCFQRITGALDLVAQAEELLKRLIPEAEKAQQYAVELEARVRKDAESYHQSAEFKAKKVEKAESVLKAYLQSASEREYSIGLLLEQMTKLKEMAAKSKQSRLINDEMAAVQKALDYELKLQAQDKAKIAQLQKIVEETQKAADESLLTQKDAPEILLERAESADGIVEGDARTVSDLEKEVKNRKEILDNEPDKDKIPEHKKYYEESLTRLESAKTVLAQDQEKAVKARKMSDDALKTGFLSSTYLFKKIDKLKDKVRDLKIAVEGKNNKGQIDDAEKDIVKATEKATQTAEIAAKPGATEEQKEAAKYAAIDLENCKSSLEERKAMVAQCEKEYKTAQEDLAKYEKMMEAAKQKEEATDKTTAKITEAATNANKLAAIVKEKTGQTPTTAPVVKPLPLPQPVEKKDQTEKPEPVKEDDKQTTKTDDDDEFDFLDRRKKPVPPAKTLNLLV